ncbi:polymorphic toxin-type HINT domain-containing protein [Enterococcus sp. LJL128]
MSIDMYLGASQTQADSTKTMCHEAQQGLETLQSGIKDFVGDQVLSGKTYRTAKSYFEAVYVPLIQGAILVSEATAEAVSKIPEQYRADVAQVDLKSSELEEEIEKWEQQIQAMEHQIVEVKRVLPVSSERVQHINEINNVITSYQEIKRMLEKKLQKLLTFHAFSSMLFTEVNALKAAVNTGLAQIKSGSAYNAEYGVFDMSRMNMDWATTIAEKAADWRKRKLKEEGMDLDEKLKTRRYVQVDLYGMKSWMWLENPPYISADDYKVNEAYREWAEKEFDLYGREIKRGNDIDEMSRLAIELREGVDYDTGRPLTDVEKAQRWSIVLSSIAQVSIAAYYAGHPLTVEEAALMEKQVSGPKCFVSGTLILTEHGHKPIECIQIGEKVLARHENSNVQTYEKVVQLFVSETNKIIRITVGNEVIETTEEHPFYLPSKGWIKAKELTYNDNLIDSFENTLSITNIQSISLNRPVKVYNFEVENAHTYFVSNLNILVHNICDDALNKWHKGTFDDSEASLIKHFEKHGAEVKANSLEQYFNKAEDFSRKLKGARSKKIDYPTPNVVRYYKNGKYIDIHKPTGKIISFGKQ